MKTLLYVAVGIVVSSWVFGDITKQSAGDAVIHIALWPVYLVQYMQSHPSGSVNTAQFHFSWNLRN